MSIPEALVESAAKAIHADVCCPADGTDGACAYPNYLWGDRHVARIALEAVADDIRAEALRDAADAWQQGDRLIDAYQQLRPASASGKHGDLHTDHCGCAGKSPEPRVVTTADELDALPPGSVVVDCEDDVWKRHTDHMCGISGVGPHELAGHLPATVLREGWGDRATPSPDRGAA